MEHLATTLETILVFSGYAGIFALMSANGLISFPSSQILYLLAGYLSSLGFFNPALIIFIGALGNTLGNMGLYEITRTRGVNYALSVSLLPQSSFERVSNFLSGRGLWFVFLGKLIPAIKVAVPIAAGLGKTPRVKTGLIFFFSSLLWATFFVYAGLIFGKSTDLISRYSLSIAFIAILIALFLYFSIYRGPHNKTEEGANIKKE